MNELSFRPAVVSDLLDIVAMLADDELGRQREDPSIPLNPKYADSFAAIDRDSNQILVVVAFLYFGLLSKILRNLDLAITLIDIR